MKLFEHLNITFSQVEGGITKTKFGKTNNSVDTLYEIPLFSRNSNVTLGVRNCFWALEKLTVV